MEKITLGSLKDRQRYRDKSGASLLHLSVKDAANYYLACCKYGIPDQYDSSNDHVKITSYLILCGYEIDAQDSAGRTPLMFAVDVKRPYIAIMKVLLNANASIYVSDNKGESVLKIIIKKCQMWFQNLKPEPEQLQIVELIFSHVKRDYVHDKLATLTKLRDANCSMAFMAFMNGSADETKSLLIDHSIKPMLSKSKYGLTGLHMAVMRQDLGQVKVFIDWGVDINAKDSHEQTALFAHDVNSEETDVKIAILQVLLKSGASLIISRGHRFENNGRTPMEYLLKYGRTKTVFTVLRSDHPDLMKKCEAGGTALHYLVQNRNFRSRESIFKAITLLLNKGFDINMCNCRGLNALTIIVKTDDRTKFEDIIMFLIENGAKLNFIKILKNASKLDYHEAVDALEFYEKIIEMMFKQQGIDIRRATKLMKKRFPKEDDTSVVIHIVTAYTVIAEAKGEISCIVNQENIGAEDTLQNRYDMCSVEIEEMKSVIVKDSVTLYTFLIESDEQIVSYVLKEDFIGQLTKLMKQKIYENSFYSVIIRGRVKAAQKLIKQRQDGRRMFCKLMGLQRYGMTEDHHILENIFCYFNDRDFRNLANVKDVRSVGSKIELCKKLKTMFCKIR